MKKIRRLFGIGLSCFLLLMTCLLTNAQEISTSKLLVDMETSNEIFDKYQKEISYIEAKRHMNISALNKETLNIIKLEAVANLKNESLNFSGLMTSIALACAASDEGLNNVNTDFCNDQSTRAVGSYGIICGQHIIDVAVGVTSTVSGSSTFSISAGSELLGVTVGESFTLGYQYSLTGPEQGIYLTDGKNVTHRTAFGVLYGTILHSNLRGYYIEPNTASAIDYTMLAYIGNPTYCRQAGGSGTLYFSTYADYKNTIKSHPSSFI